MADYFVKTTGNDSTGDGSFAFPWASVTFALTQIVNNDRIWVESGNYTETSWNINAYVYIRGYGVSMPKITMSASNPIIYNSNNRIFLINLHFIFTSTSTGSLNNGISGLGVRSGTLLSLIFNCVIDGSSYYGDNLIGNTAPVSVEDLPYIANCVLIRGITGEFTSGTSNGSYLTYQRGTIDNTVFISDNGNRTIWEGSDLWYYNLNLKYSNIFTNPTGSGVVQTENQTSDPIVDSNYSPEIGSPLLNSGNPSSEFDNIDGSRNTIGITGGPYILLLFPEGLAPAPTSSDFSIDKNENTTYSFTTDDFIFNSEEPSARLGGIRFNTLPLSGNITYNGLSVDTVTLYEDVTLLSYSTEIYNLNDSSFTFFVKDSLGQFSESYYTCTINLLQDNYFVDENGSDSASGEITSPYATLGKALEVATVSGNIVYVNGDTTSGFTYSILDTAFSVASGVQVIGLYTTDIPVIKVTGDVVLTWVGSVANVQIEVTSGGGDNPWVPNEPEDVGPWIDNNPELPL